VFNFFQQDTQQGQLDFAKLWSLPVSQMNRPCLRRAAKKKFCRWRIKMNRDHPVLVNVRPTCCAIRLFEAGQFPIAVKTLFLSRLWRPTCLILNTFDDNCFYKTLMCLRFLLRINSCFGLSGRVNDWLPNEWV